MVADYSFVKKMKKYDIANVPNFSKTQRNYIMAKAKRLGMKINIVLSKDGKYRAIRVK